MAKEHNPNEQGVLSGAVSSESIDLIYIDPPFFSGRQYNTPGGAGVQGAAFNAHQAGSQRSYVVVDHLCSAMPPP